MVTAAAAGAGAVAVGVSVGGNASAGELGDSPGSEARTDLARVREARGKVLRVDFPRVGSRSRALMAPDATASQETVPLVGFPEGISPRPGDRVMVTDWWDGMEVAAIPVVSWVTGVPKPLPGGGYQVGGRRTAPTPLLKAAGERRSRTAVCLLDTELDTAQVMAVRAPSR
ncbi:hypothetical protein ACFVYD_06155 [Streptomyces sp. NPDC058301]|uniref:hypothetical protein n=1 Tax=Streptomyces sp. NPDC058301 TaxID=3346436 RepID=UPI0036E22234